APSLHLADGLALQLLCRRKVPRDLLPDGGQLQRLERPRPELYRWMSGKMPARLLGVGEQTGQRFVAVDLGRNQPADAAPLRAIISQGIEDRPRLAQRFAGAGALLG